MSAVLVTRPGLFAVHRRKPGTMLPTWSFAQGTFHAGKRSRRRRTSLLNWPGRSGFQGLISQVDPVSIDNRHAGGWARTSAARIFMMFPLPVDVLSSAEIFLHRFRIPRESDGHPAFHRMSPSKEPRYSVSSRSIIACGVPPSRTYE